MSKYAILTGILIVLGACSSKNKVETNIDFKQMTEIVADCLEVEAANINFKGLQNTDVIVDSSARWYGGVLKKHKLNLEELNAAFQAYMQDPIEWNRVLDSTERVLQKRMDAFNN